MIVVIKPGTPRAQVDEVIAEVEKLGYKPHPIFGTELTVIAAIGDERTHHTLESLTAMPQVEKVMPVQKKHNLVSRVPWRYAGAGRRVYPGFMQLSAFMSMNRERHLNAFTEYYQHLKEIHTQRQLCSMRERPNHNCLRVSC